MLVPFIMANRVFVPQIIFNPSGISPDDISSSDGQIVFLEGENVEL